MSTHRPGHGSVALSPREHLALGRADTFDEPVVQLRSLRRPAVGVDVGDHQDEADQRTADRDGGTIETPSQERHVRGCTVVE